ncbi:MAG TPA: NUDIX domain-containing protein [Pyrinomonadaceae bacterium]|nr:NUDIX domain-containing protein [Pyrinomonadaceae bacterium]
MEEQLTHAGGVVFRRQDESTLYLVVSSSDKQNWVLPKGHIDPGESAETAALREVTEEAGVIGELLQPLSTRTLIKFGKSCLVQYFLIREVSSTKATEGRTLRWEHERAALQLLTFAEAKAALLEGAAALKSEGPY